MPVCIFNCLCVNNVSPNYLLYYVYSLYALKQPLTLMYPCYYYHAVLFPVALLLPMVCMHLFPATVLGDCNTQVMLHAMALCWCHVFPAVMP